VHAVVPSAKELDQFPGVRAVLRDVGLLNLELKDRAVAI
jgi:hypothetical protein